MLSWDCTQDRPFHVEERAVEHLRYYGYPFVTRRYLYGLVAGSGSPTTGAPGSRPSQE